MSAVEAMRKWRDSPLRFVLEVLRLRPDAWQVEVLEAVRTHNRIALKASKGVGKSTVLAWIIWWFLATRLHPKVICTSVTEDNLRDGLWAELSKWQQRSPLLLATFTWTAQRITSNEHPETWWASARTWPKGGDSSQQANTLAGVHADHVLFVLDEAGGIPDAVSAAAEGGLANADAEEGREAKLLLAGNPTHLDGPLYRACTSERDLWFVYEISGDPDDPLRAPRVSEQWAREQIAKWGRDNPYVRVNVFGKFPLTASNALLGPEDVAAAMKREIHQTEFAGEVKIMGVDCARFGDDRSVIFLRQGRATYRPKVMRNLDTQDLASQVALSFDKHQPDALFIDQATFGAGTLDRLRHLGYPAIGVDFGGKSLSPKFANKRSEMWMGMSDWIRSGGGSLPNMPELTKELTAPIYKFDAENKLQLERKSEIKKRTGVSPDLADALALTFAAPVAPRSLRHLMQQGRQHVERPYDPHEEAW